MLNKQQINHISVLDSLRGLAAMSVCVYHFIVGPINFVTDERALSFFSFGKYGVQLFFVISGFVIPWSLYNKKYEISNFFKFLFKRLVRLEPPYLFSVLLVLLLYFLRHYFLSENDVRVFSVRQVLLHIGYLIPFFEKYNWINEVYWTLAIEFQFYIFIGVAYFALNSKNKIWRFLSFVVILSLHYIGNNQFLFYWLPVFLLGNLLFQFKKEIITKKEYYFYTILCLGFIACFIGIPVLVSCLIATISIMYFQNFNSLIGSWLGKISYSIYLTHTIIGSAVINILSHHVTSSIGVFFVVIAGIIITILFSYITYLLVEKKSQKFSMKISY